MTKIKAIPYNKWDYEIDERVSYDCSEARYHQDYWTEDDERQIINFHQSTHLIELTNTVKNTLEEAGIEVEYDNSR